MCDCLNPTYGWRVGKMTAKDGIISDRITFSEREASEYFAARFGSELAEKMKSSHVVTFPCGKCLNCQREKRKDWSTRLVHEASMHDKACMITLTYDDEHLPLTDDIPFESNTTKHFWRPGECPHRLGAPTLCLRDVQLFLKRLRRYLEYHGKGGHFRYFCCGEYGTKSRRPHYHLIIFGWDDPEKTFFFEKNGNAIYLSAVIKACWDKGFHTVSEISPALAKYCARYCTKKMVGATPPDFLVPEFILQSRRGGGIGSVWLERFRYNLVKGLLTYRIGERILKVSTPKYYLSWLRRNDPDLWCFIRANKVDWLQRQKVASKPPVCFEDKCRKAEHYFLQITKEKQDETESDSE